MQESRDVALRHRKIPAAQVRAHGTDTLGPLPDLAGDNSHWGTIALWANGVAATGALVSALGGAVHAYASPAAPQLIDVVAMVGGTAVALAAFFGMHATARLKEINDGEIGALRLRLADRALDGDARQRFVTMLQSAACRCPIQVVSSVNEDEAERFAARVEHALIEAGWSTERYLTHDMIRPGIGLAQRNAGTPEPCLSALQTAFNTIDVTPFLCTYGGEAPDGCIQVLVGRKPATF